MLDDDREALASDASSAAGLRRPTLSMLSLAALCFSAVAGGPIGIESAVSSGGAFLTLVTLLAIAVAWAFPLAMITAELAAAMPTNGGAIDWVDRGLGFVATCCLCASLLFNQIFDLPLYTVLLASSLQQLFDLAAWQAALLKLGVVAVTAAVNVVGLDAVASSAMVMTLLVMVPFLLTPVVAAVAGQSFDWSALSPAAIPAGLQGSAGVFVAGLLWNMQGWNQLGNLAAEIADPQRSYPRGLLLALAAVTASYAYCVAFGAALQPDASAWDDGYLVQVGAAVAPWLGYLCGVAAAVASLSLYATNLACYSRGVQAMVRCGALPLPWLAWEAPRFGTPAAAIALLSLTSAVLSFLDLSALVVLDTTCSNINIALVTTAFVALRRAAPGMARPFRAPGGKCGAYAMAGSVAAFAGVALYAVASDTLYAALVPVGATAALAAAVAAEQRFGLLAAARRGCCCCSGRRRLAQPRGGGVPAAADLQPLSMRRVPLPHRDGDSDAPMSPATPLLGSQARPRLEKAGVEGATASAAAAIRVADAARVGGRLVRSHGKSAELAPLHR